DQALGGWKVTRREAIVQRPGKPELRVAASAVPIRNAEGALTGALVVFTDVTPESQLLSELATSEEKYRLLFDRNPEAMWVRETGTQRFLAVNETALRRYGWTRDEFLSLPLDALQPPEERARLASVRGPNDDYSGPWRHLRKDGSIIAVEISSHPIEFGGQQARLVIAADVSDRQRARELLIESEEQLRTIFDQAPIGLVRVDLGGHVREANLALRTMLGLVNTSLVGMPFARILRHPKGDSVDLVAEIVEGDRQHQAFEFPIDRGDGVARWGSATISMVRGADHEPLYLIGMLEDITDRRAHTEQLEYRALHDTLTDLPNRALFNDRLSRAILTAQGENHRLALLILDLNRFKEVNDTFGHPLGDALLQQVGPRLAEHLRDSDTLARLGGDEFAVVLPAADDQAAAELAAARILEALKEPFLVDGRELRIGGAIGIAMTPEHGTDAQTVARHADTAMYAAKRTGAGFATYSPDQDSLRPVAPDPRD
ncbi:MAG: diguanylate cyclase, partial [Candidatus Dormibacteraeota bacterium]|nr:diguanylate cyclase [Candidatus Dormibacteraeota bacterium]